jgi:hypothetical protein
LKVVRTTLCAFPQWTEHKLTTLKNVENIQWGGLKVDELMSTTFDRRSMVFITREYLGSHWSLAQVGSFQQRDYSIFL